MEYHYDFTKIPRPIQKSLKLEFLRMDINRSPDTPIWTGDTVDVHLKCRANGDFDNMKLRFEIIAADNTVAGTMFLSDNLSAKAGEVIELHLGINTEHLVPGNYRFDLLAFEMNDFGMQDWVDKIEGAPVLEIEKRNPKDLEWLPQWWGHTRFSDIQLQDVKRS